MRLSLFVGLYVAQVSGMATFRVGKAVLAALGIVMTTRAHAIRRGTILVLVDVEGVLLAWGPPASQTLPVAGAFSPMPD